MPVYFVQSIDGGPVKIGWTTNLKERLSRIQKDLSINLKLLGILNTPSKHEERRIHKQFKHIRLYGEWFDDTSELLDFIANLNDDTLTNSANKPNTVIALKIRPTNLRDRIISRYFDLMTAAGFDISDVIREEVENSLRHRGIWEKLEQEIIGEAHGRKDI